MKFSGASKDDYKKLSKYLSRIGFFVFAEDAAQTFIDETYEAFNESII